MDSRVAYSLLVGFVVVERVGELVLARRHDAGMRAAGGVEEGASMYPWMVAMHSAFPISCVAEVWWLARPWLRPLGMAMVAAMVGAMLLRAWTVRSLGPRWTTRVLVVPGSELVTSGPYRFLRHPNYLAVRIEMLALPLVHTAWITAIAFSVLNGMLLAKRVRIEEAALARWSVTPERMSQ